MRQLVGGLVGAVAALGLMAGSAVAAPGQPGNAPSSSGWVVQGSAVWQKHAGDDRGENYGLVTTSTSGTYGGASLGPPALPTTDPNAITALSYDFNAAQSGPSGGSPRMIVCFDAACDSNAELGPNNWTANTWVHVDGFAASDGANNIWVNDGGSCGYVYNTTWSQIKVCHAGASITEVEVVNDSGWEYPASSEQITLDNLDVNGVVASGP